MRVCEATRLQYAQYIARYVSFSESQVPQVNPSDAGNDLTRHLIRFLTFFADGNVKLSVIYLNNCSLHHLTVIQDLEPEVITGPLKLGFALPTAKSIADVMNQWNFGGLNFKPLKDWNSFKPETYRSVKDAYRTRKIIAERVLLSENIESFKLQFS
jgi:hypothetical protein